jgi:hypothetical protein
VTITEDGEVSNVLVCFEKGIKSAVRPGGQDVRAPHHPTDTSQMFCPFVPLAM